MCFKKTDITELSTVGVWSHLCFAARLAVENNLVRTIFGFIFNSSSVMHGALLILCSVFIILFIFFKFGQKNKSLCVFKRTPSANVVRKHTFGPNAPPLLASREANLDGRTERGITPEHVTGAEL